MAKPNLTDEQKQQIVQEHKDMLSEMNTDVSMMESKLGRNHPAAQKMRTIWETFASLTEQELFDLESCDPAYDVEEAVVVDGSQSAEA
jgi:hypothetical protein